MSHQLDNLDLDLMRLLKAVVDNKSIKLAAMQLGISQPSASRGVMKLKQVFNDPLFVRKAHGVEPSPMAVRLAAEFDNMLAPLEKVLLEFEEFDPERYTGHISLVVDPYLMDEQGQTLLTCCYQAFPQATFTFASWTAYSQDEMLEGVHDYCILDQETDIAKDIYMRPLFSEKRVILARKNHPTLSETNDWETVASLPLVSLPAPASYKPLCTVESEYQRMGYEPDVVLKSYNLRVACQMLLETNAIMFASNSSARLMPELASYTMPPVNREFSHFVVSGGYLQVYRNHPLHQYLHQVLQQVFAQ
ncbi:MULTISPECIES: LysR family transcriptional regulator [Vibrio]|uniref:Putative LysR family transcriptional regulator n=2 Tax=Vibrio TaxID=662 RepID=U2ZJX2_VIBPR|nr:MULTISPECIES: LysR family transcriptional regulator [Vibrio]NAW57453.1 LysR family transcriptional regulator [Vibrio sp. V36_P2S2PM302]NAX27140.1 LysR family transcriptional regulator [Vibrio sp. V38_P2S17PM301]NAX30303.1 LysR family transcriptional regulator [Vibrio sp. V37_P2S8PM304]GAD68066.1 putative LysR family transcriptional regulator [Vibrio proteolyticus NBRC 13287]